MRTEHMSGSEFDSYQLSLTLWMLHIYTAPNSSYYKDMAFNALLFITDNILDNWSRVWSQSVAIYHF